jgi:hypothetical protein
VLAKWHPLLEEYESSRAEGESVRAHEAEWERAADLRGVLEDLRSVLLEYANLLASVAGVAPLIALDEAQTDESS